MLSVTDIQLSYGRGQDELFGGLSHAFTPARVTAVTGASGRGKSTLLYMLGLVLRPTGGAVVLDDRTVSQLPDRERSALRARSIGFVFQDAVLDPSRTILDAVIEPALYAGVRRRPAALRAQALLEEFRLARRAMHRPGQISGGQAQRVAICRALVNDPQVVLADEPTGNLDRDNAAALLGTLRDVARSGRTVIIATHDPFVLEHADETLAL